MAFPGFKFTYAVDPEYGPKKFTPLRGEQVFRNQFGFIHLFVEDGDGERFEWATVKLDFRGKTEVISILDVRRDGKTIKVNYKEKPDPATRPKSAGNGASPAVPFMLSALSLGAVVLLIRRQRTPSAGG